MNDYAYQARAAVGKVAFIATSNYQSALLDSISHLEALRVTIEPQFALTVAVPWRARRDPCPATPRGEGNARVSSACAGCYASVTLLAPLAPYAAAAALRRRHRYHR